RHELALRVAYHDACHLGHAQGVTAQPRQVLRSIPGLELVELGDAGTCCGSAGIYNLVQPEAAADLGRAKAASVRAAAADVVVSANPGCLLQLRRHLGPQPPLAHPVELLDASIRGVNPWPAGDLGLSGSPGRDREPLAGSAPRSAPRPR
ncbi:MAG: heterodisulfide reductase-related iron-sulfur binding cluster, partial [Acidimicrobiales bacterium]